MSQPGGYSSQSFSPSSTGAAKRQSQPSLNNINSTGKTREKEDMVGLNDKFVKLIDKVKNLEDENKKLDTKLKILKEQEAYEGKVDAVVRQLENELEQQIENLLHDQEKLQAELLKNQEELEDTKQRFEDEIVKKADVENDFIVTKKEVDEGHLEEVNLVLELEDLMGKLEFLRVGYDEEIKELESLVQNKTVILPDNRKRYLDMDEIVGTVKNQYARVAARTREEAELWNQRKDALVVSAGQREQDVRELKREISDTQRLIQRLNADMEVLIRKEESLKKDISSLRTEGDKNLEKAREDIALLEEALKRAKHDLTGQIREHQELMNLKLALDIEIATYRKLLEGEEERMNQLLRLTDVPLSEKPRAPKSPKTLTPPPAKKRVMIQVEVDSGREVSQSSCYIDD
uniref:intermediate filament protein ON3-like isoform X2 n=1 Tax=Solea senegalensis TaxID=28829 RepID=UPI001CD8842F|nr:intermediate filament protein ON3-like isoform X2 [Solea senegalensis]